MALSIPVQSAVSAIIISLCANECPRGCTGAWSVYINARVVAPGLGHNDEWAGPKSKKSRRGRPKCQCPSPLRRVNIWPLRPFVLPPKRDYFFLKASYLGGGGELWVSRGKVWPIRKCLWRDHAIQIRTQKGHFWHLRTIWRPFSIFGGTNSRKADVWILGSLVLSDPKYCGIFQFSWEF